MRKIFAAMVVVFVISSQAFAGVRVNVPSGWTREDQGNTVIIRSKSSNASVVIAFNSMGGADLTDIVERLYIQMEGRDLAQDSDGDYSFSFTNNSGASSLAMVTSSDGYYLVISMSGFEGDEEIQADMEKIFDSLDYEDD